MVPGASDQDAEGFLRDTGCMHWFGDKEAVGDGTGCAPTFSLRVLDRRPDGEEEVYDISVGGTENFLAGGAVAHNCIPSRMTIGKLMEIVASKLGALRGEKVNATAFNNFNIKDFEENLHQYGFHRHGTERLVWGSRGSPSSRRSSSAPATT